MLMLYYNSQKLFPKSLEAPFIAAAANIDVSSPMHVCEYTVMPAVSTIAGSGYSLVFDLALTHITLLMPTPSGNSSAHTPRCHLQALYPNCTIELLYVYIYQWCMVMAWKFFFNAKIILTMFPHNYVCLLLVNRPLCDVTNLSKNADISHWQVTPTQNWLVLVSTKHKVQWITRRRL